MSVLNKLFFISARRSILLDTQHPDGLEKIRELEAQGHPARLEVDEPPVTPPRFVTELRVYSSEDIFLSLCFQIITFL